ncbi:MAG: ATP-binding protein [bacterium]|nr:ATP-binding protein [bacterium]
MQATYPLLINWDFSVVGLAIMATVILGFIVFLSLRRSATHITFFLFTFFIAFWSIANYLSSRPLPVFYAFSVLRLTLFTATLYTFSFFLFALSFPDQRIKLSKIYVIILSIWTSIISILTLTPLVLKEVGFLSPDGIILSAVNGPLMPVFGMTTVGYAIVGLVILVVKTFKADKNNRRKFIFVTTGVAAMFLAVMMTNFFLPVVFNNPSYLPFAAIFIFPFVAFTAYAIIKHRLFDIRIFIIRAASFLLTMAVLTVAYAFVLLAVIKEVLGLQFDITVSAISIALALLILTTFRPLESFFRQLTNRIFHAVRYDPDELLTRLNNIISRTVDLEKMTNETLKLLTEQMGIAKGAWLLVDDHKIINQFDMGFGFGDDTAKELESLLHLQSTNNFSTLSTVRDPRPIELAFDYLEEGPIKQVMRSHDIDVVIPIMAEDAEIAILVLGSKLSGEGYFHQDMNLLNIFTAEAGFAIQNAKLYSDVKELSESKSKFINVVSHQLRTPVSALRWSLESLSQNKLSEADRRKMVDNAYQSTVFLGGQLDDILVALDIYDRKLLVKKTDCDLSEIVNEIIKDFKDIIFPKRLVISRDFKSRAVIVPADYDKLKRILKVIISNAIAYSHKDGEIKITSSLDQVGDKNRVVISVSDQGIGIDGDEKGHIFDQFFRGDKARTTLPDGLGLGMFIARSFIRAHGGDIWFYSEGRDKGTDFYFALPIE